MAAATDSKGKDAAMKSFFVDAIGGALDLGLAVPDDVLKHVTPDVLAAHLPRALWAKLLTACLAAPRVDARLVVDTIGVPDLCAHVPGTILWSILADVAVRALGKGLLAAPPPPAEVKPATPEAKVAAADPKAAAPEPRPAAATSSFGTGARASTSPPIAASLAPKGATPAPAQTAVGTSPGVPVVTTSTPASGPTPTPTPTPAPQVTTTTSSSGPLRAPTITTTAAAAVPVASVSDIDIDFDDDEPAPLGAPPAAPHRAPTVPGPQAQANRGNGRSATGAGASSRRPQARRTTPPSPRRGPTNTDFDLDTDVGNVRAAEDLPVDDDQLVDWSSSEETVTSGVETDRPKR